MTRVNSETLEQLQDEAFALMKAWEDRGLDLGEAAMVLAATSHAALAELGFSLGQLIDVMVQGWKHNNGKL